MDYTKVYIMMKEVAVYAELIADSADMLRNGKDDLYKSHLISTINQLLEVVVSNTAISQNEMKKGNNND